jgi:hypothetical protein
MNSSKSAFTLPIALCNLRAATPQKTGHHFAVACDGVFTAAPALVRERH